MIKIKRWQCYFPAISQQDRGGFLGWEGALWCRAVTLVARRGCAVKSGL